MKVLLLVLVGCNGDEPAADGTTEGIVISDVSATVSDAITTVVAVRWTTDVPTVGWVDFGPGGDLLYATPVPSEPATEHEATLLGLPPGTDCSYQVVVDDGAGEQADDVRTVTTGRLPTELAGLTPQGDGNDVFLAVPVLGSATFATLVEPGGEFTWWHAEDSGLDTYRVRISVDGQSVLYNAGSVSGDPADDSAIVRVSLDGSQETRTSLPLLAHDFVELDDGTIAAIVVEYRDDADGEPIRGDSIVEVAPDGTQTTVWSAWDCFDPEVTWGDDSDFGWTFANALDYDDSDDAWLLGIRNFSTIVKIDRATGSCDWAFGGAGATFEPDAGSASFLHQHQFELEDGHLLVFDNDGAAGNVSRVLEYAFDPDTPQATETWSYTADPTIYGFVLGDVARLPDGDTMVTWSVAGQIDRVAADGSVVWQLNLPIGSAFGFDTVLSDLYPGR